MEILEHIFTDPLFILFGMPGIYLLIRGNYKIRKLNSIQQSGMSCQAKITEKCIRSMKAFGSGHNYWPKFDYTFIDYKGNTQKGIFELFGFGGNMFDAADDETFKIGDKIEVLYLKNNPKHNYPKSEINDCLKAMNQYYYYGLGLALFGSITVIDYVQNLIF